MYVEALDCFSSSPCKTGSLKQLFICFSNPDWPVGKICIFHFVLCFTKICCIRAIRDRGEMIMIAEGGGGGEGKYTKILLYTNDKNIE